MTKFYMTKEFSRFARKAELAPAKMLEAASGVVQGRYDADLGGGVFKQRVARDGGGKSGGFRTIILFRVGGHVFLVHGFAKNAKANVSARELKALKRLADLYIGFSEDRLSYAESTGELIELEKESGGRKES
jgi:hypothetical protein